MDDQQKPLDEDPSIPKRELPYLNRLKGKWVNDKVGQTFVILKGVKKESNGDDSGAQERAMLKVQNLQTKAKKWKQEKGARKSEFYFRMRNMVAPVLFILGLITLCTFFTPIHYPYPYDNFGNYYANDLTNVFTTHPIDCKKFLLYILIWFLICAALQYTIKSFKRTEIE